jgi:hypothetical protein
MYREAAALIRDRFDGDVALMQFNQAAAERQSQARTNVAAFAFTAGAAAVTAFDLLERLKQAALLIRWNTNSLIPHAEPHHAIVHLRSNPNAAMVMGKLDCITQKIDQNLAQAEFIGGKETVG